MGVSAVFPESKHPGHTYRPSKVGIAQLIYPCAAQFAGDTILEDCGIRVLSIVVVGAEDIAFEGGGR